jgi:hypothetical protein
MNPRFLCPLQPMLGFVNGCPNGHDEGLALFAAL